MPSSTDWIQTCAVVTGLCLAVYELFLREDLSKREQKRAVLHFVEVSGSESVISGANALLRASGTVGQLTAQQVADEQRLTNAIVALTPYTQYLESFAFCYDQGLCDGASSRAFVCDKIRPYEMIMENMLADYSVPLARKLEDDRPLRSTKLWSDCEQQGSQG